MTRKYTLGLRVQGKAIQCCIVPRIVIRIAMRDAIKPTSAKDFTCHRKIFATFLSLLVFVGGCAATKEESRKQLASHLKSYENISVTLGNADSVIKSIDILLDKSNKNAFISLLSQSETDKLLKIKEKAETLVQCSSEISRERITNYSGFSPLGKDDASTSGELSLRLDYLGGLKTCDQQVRLLTNREKDRLNASILQTKDHLKKVEEIEESKREEERKTISIALAKYIEERRNGASHEGAVSNAAMAIESRFGGHSIENWKAAREFLVPKFAKYDTPEGESAWKSGLPEGKWTSDEINSIANEVNSKIEKVAQKGRMAIASGISYAAARQELSEFIKTIWNETIKNEGPNSPNRETVINLMKENLDRLDIYLDRRSN